MARAQALECPDSGAILAIPCGGLATQTRIPSKARSLCIFRVKVGRSVHSARRDQKFDGIGHSRRAGTALPYLLAKDSRRSLSGIRYVFRSIYDPLRVPQIHDSYEYDRCTTWSRY